MEACCHACIGGTNVREDIVHLSEKSIHTVVGTPGRVYDMINRNALSKYSVILGIFSLASCSEMAFQSHKIFGFFYRAQN